VGVKEGKETEKMKRIILMLALTALLVLALSLSAVTAFADSGKVGNNNIKIGNKSTNPNDGHGRVR
jgi:hypothetical protein